MMSGRDVEAAPTGAARVWLSGFEEPHRAILAAVVSAAAEE
jgi:hypothetical protein